MNPISVCVPVFEETGYFTAIPNALFDQVQPRLSLSAWAVLCAIVRRTRGWGKTSDAISYEQIKQATGLKSDTTVAKALAELLSDARFGRALLCREARAGGQSRRRETACYALNPRFEVEVVRAGPDLGLGPETPTSLYGEDVGAPSSENGVEGPPGSPENGETKERVFKPSLSRFGARNFGFSPGGAIASGSAPPSPSTSDFAETPLFRAVCAATQRDPALVSPKMRAQLMACADKLAVAGYDVKQIELAAQRWPLAVAPYPFQLLDNIQALLGARPACAASASSYATHSSHAARPDAGASSRNPVAAPRFESAAQRKGRKWAQWLDDIA